MGQKSENLQGLREPALGSPALMQRMQEQHMSDLDQQAAAEWLHDGEAVADFICRATDALRATASFLEHRFAQRSR
jgi:hypothetical protein